MDKPARGGDQGDSDHPKKLTLPQRRDRDKNRILEILKGAGATPEEILHIGLIGFSESDYDNDAEATMQDGIHKTYGIFQMSDQWHGTREQIINLDYSTMNRLTALRKLGPLDLGSQPLVRKCWGIQRWAPWQLDASYEEWLKSPSTQNYVNRVARISKVLTDPNYFEKGNT